MTVDSMTTPAGVERIVGRIGWWVLVVLTALLLLNHVAGTLLFANTSNEGLMFMVFAAVQVLALIVLFIPYRRKEMWAWMATWVSIIPVGLVFAFGADSIGVFYLVVGLLMALAQLATLPDFRDKGR